MTKWILNWIFPVLEWRTDTKNGYEDKEVYIEYRYVLVSSTGRNHAKMAAFSFNMARLLISMHVNNMYYFSGRQK